MTRARDLADGKHLTNVDSNTLAVDATNNRVFVGASSGDRKFEVHDTGVVVANFKSTGANSLMAFDNSSDTSQNHMIGFSGDDFRVVETTEKIRVLSSGGITFNGDTATANALSDYEEGTFTATLEGSSSNPSSTVQTTSARYTKVGRLVFVQGQFSNVDTTGASGAPRVTGLPFGAATSYATGNVMTYNRFTLGTTASNVSPYVAGSTIFFYQSTTQTGWAEIAHSAGSGAYLAFTATYET